MADVGAPFRLEAKVSSVDGMPLLCAIEAALGQAPAKPATQELVWLNEAPASGAHVLEVDEVDDVTWTNISQKIMEIDAAVAAA